MFMGFVATVLIVFLVFLIIMLLRMLNPSQTGVAGGEGYSHVATIYGVNDKDLLSGPTGVARSSDGNLLIADMGNSRVLKFNFRGHFIDSFSYPPKVPLKLKDPKLKLNKQAAKQHQKVNMKQSGYQPAFIAVGPNGDIYVTYPANGMIAVFDKDYKPIRQIPLSDNPLAVAVRGNQLYVTSSHIVSIYSTAGKILHSIGDPNVRSSALGYWLFPNGLDVLESGELLVGDSNNSRVVKLGPKLDKPKIFRNDAIPAGLTVTDDDKVIYLRVLRSDLEVVDGKGKELKTIGGPGTQDLKFINPIDIENLGDNLFAISDKGNNRVQLISIDF